MRNIFKLYSTVFKYWPYLLGGVITLFLFAGLNGANVTMIKPVLDYIFVPSKPQVSIYTQSDFINRFGQITTDFLQQHPLSQLITDFKQFQPLTQQYGNLLNITDSMLLLEMVVIAVFIIVLFKNLAFYLQQFFFINLAGRFVQDLRNQVFARYLSQPLSFWGNARQLGDAMVRLTDDVNVINTEIVSNSIIVLREVVTILVLVRIAMYINLNLFLTCAIVLPLFPFMITVLGRKIKKYAKRQRKELSEIFTSIEEVFNNLRVVKAFARERHEKYGFEQTNRRYFRFWSRGQLYDALGTPISELNSALLGAVVLIIGGRQVIMGTGAFTFGDFTAFLLTAFSMMHPIKEIGKAYTKLRRGMVSLERVYDVLNQPDRMQDKPDARSKTGFENEITLHNVNFAYAEAPVLRNINLTIKKGQTVAFVGGSGSGKTTLVNVITRLYDIEQGELQVDGIPVKDIKIEDMRALFGLVPQESMLFSETVENNIRYGSLKQLDHAAVERACAIAHADEFIGGLPNGYNEVLVAKGSKLSGGQKQRLCIARAVVGDPPILVFDEATSALDTESERRVQQAIENTTKNRTVLMIAHRLSTVLNADKIVVMEDGCIVGEGRHEELLNTCPRYKLLYSLQFENARLPGLEA